MLLFESRLRSTHVIDNRLQLQMLINKQIQEIVQTAVSTRPNAFLWGVSGLIFLIGLMLAIFGTFVSTLIGILLMVASIALIIAVAVDVWTGFKMFQNVCLIFLYISSPFVPTQT